ncbi:MAG: response regulator [Deltaproteobacteria bacterium]|nr:response regulator [Deltaproteobacteria bacterium]
MHNLIRPILLIEDNPIDIDLTRRAFVKRKVANPIEVARDGEEALAVISRWPAGGLIPVVILLNLKLPKIDGLEVLRYLKTHPEFLAIPVVVLTSSTEDRDIKEAYHLGANSYIVKPIDFEKFVDVVTQIDLYWNVINTPAR